MKSKIPLLLVLVAASAAAVIILNTRKPAPEPMPVETAAAPVPAPEAPAVPKAGPKEGSLVDQKATVFNLQGTARILKKGNGKWEPVEVGTVIAAGDQIKTETDSIVEIHYDAYFLNVAKITPNSVAEFMSIEPTKIFVSSGSIYNSLEGLPEGTTYDVITPTAVGGVRSTVFERSFDPVTQSDQTVVLEGTVYLAAGVRDASKLSEDEIWLVHQDEQFGFSGEELSSGAVKNLKPEPLSADESAAARKIIAETKEHVKIFAGGEEAIQQAVESWQAVKSDPKKLAAVKAKMDINRFYERIENKKDSSKPDSSVSPAAIAAGTAPAAAAAAAEAAPAVNTTPVTLEKKADEVVDPSRNKGTMAVHADVYEQDGTPVKEAKAG